MPRTPLVPTLLLAATLVVVALPAESAPLPGVWVIQNFTWTVGGYNSAMALRLTDDAPYGIAVLGQGTGLPVADLEKLSFDAYYNAGSCGGGSPRVTLGIDTDGDLNANGYIHAYAGPTPTFKNCPQGVWSHYDLFDGAARFDASQLVGGWVRTWPNTLALLPADSTILSANFVWDSAWLFPAYQVTIDNLRVNGALLNEPGVGDACSAAAVHGGFSC